MNFDPLQGVPDCVDNVRLNLHLNITVIYASVVDFLQLLTIHWGHVLRLMNLVAGQGFVEGGTEKLVFPFSSVKQA